MAIINADSTEQAALGFHKVPLWRQLGLMIGLAASVALGVAVVMWSQEPDFRPIYSNMQGANSIDVTNALAQAAIPFKIDEENGTVLVPSSKIYSARMQLAKSGVELSDSYGFEALEKQSAFGSSQFMEQARYKRALEGELSRTISSIKDVKAARVHLVIPKQSAFNRSEEKSTASVFLELFSGRTLDSEQIGSITNLVASSVSNLDPKNVTIVDQKGTLLNAGDGDSTLSVAGGQLAYVKQVESLYIKQVEAMLSPLLGPENFRAQVAAKIDFTHTEKTQELFDSDKAIVRSEEIENENRESGPSVGGVPGQLLESPVPQATQAANPVPAAASNSKGQPASTPATTTPDASANNKPAKSGFGRNHQIKNYEVDKTILHTKEQPWKIKNISVAVVINDKQQMDPKTNTMVTVARTPEEIKKITTLVQDAVGFDTNRGDKVSVINGQFAEPAKEEPLPPPTLWQQEWFITLVKQILAGLFVVILVIGVLRPVLKALVSRGTSPGGGGSVATEQMLLASPGTRILSSNGGSGNGEDDIDEIEIAPAEYEKKLKAVKKMVGEDPKRVAQVVKSWVKDGLPPQ